MIKLKSKVDLSGCTLIIPSVAVGNIGQLAVDLLILNIKMKKIGHIISPCFVPILGIDPYIKGSTELCTNIDIYYSEEKKIIAIQIRSPSVKGLHSFFNELKEFIQIQNISKVVILTSGWAHIRNDAQLNSEPFRYLASSSIETEYGKKFEELKWIKLEPTKNPSGGSDCFKIFGGGFAMKLYNYLSINQVSTIIISKFASEGDNIPDAVELAAHLDNLLPCGIINSDGKIDVEHPHSWEFLYGGLAEWELLK